MKRIFAVLILLCVAAAAQDQTKNQQLTINVVTVAPLTLSCPPVFPSAKVVNNVGLPYKNSDGSAVQCTAAGGVAPYKWSVSTGSLPGGLTLTGTGTNNATGVIGGTPLPAAITQTATIQVGDSTGTIATIILKWNPGDATIANYNLYRGAKGGPYVKVGSVAAPNVSWSETMPRSPASDLFYVATAKDAVGHESGFSNEATVHVQ
jgi:hypothetical protein